MHALYYANKLLLRVRLAFQKLFQTRQTSRNEKKQLIKNRFWLELSIICETHKLTRHQSKEFSYITFSTEQTKKFTRKTIARADIIYSQRKIKQILTQNIKVHRKALYFFRYLHPQ